MKMIYLLLLSVAFVIPSPVSASEGDDEEVREKASSKGLTLKEAQIGTGYYASHKGAHGIGVVSHLGLQDINDGHFKWFLFNPEIDGALHWDIRNGQIDYANIDAYIFALGGGVNLDGTMLIEFFPIGARFIRDTYSHLDFIGAQIDFIRWKCKYSFSNKSDIAFDTRVFGFYVGKGEVFEKSFIWPGGFTMDASLAMSYNLNILSLRGVLHYESFPVWTIDTKIPEGGSTIADFTRHHFSARFEVNKIGKSPVGLFYRYNYYHANHEHVTTLDYFGSNSAHTHLVGVSASY